MLAFGVFLVAGLVVVPAMTDEAEAGCKSKKSKKHDFIIPEDYSYQMIKCGSGNPEHW